MGFGARRSLGAARTTALKAEELGAPPIDFWTARRGPMTPHKALQILLAILVLAFVIWFILQVVVSSTYNHILASRRRLYLHILATRKKTERDEAEHEALETAPRVSEAEELAIIRLDAAQIVARVTKGELSALKVASVFSLRARDIGRKLLNSVTEELYGVAVEEAAMLDTLSAEEAQAGRVPSAPGVLEGVPISIKDNIDVQGTDSTAGLACRCFNPAQKDALVVRLLRDEGAIPFVKSNVPQALLVPETENAVYGRSLNPWDTRRTPGGSSGGEAALIAARCSPLGIGTDIGGSIRMPCAFTGIFGFKPTPERVSRKGISIPRVKNRSGQVIIPSAPGPMGRSVEDLARVMRAWCVPRVWREEDPYVTPKPFDNAAYQQGAGGRPLRIGLISTDHWFQPCKSVSRALVLARDALEQAGHVVVPTDLPLNGWETARLYYSLMGADGNMHGLVQGLEGEALLPVYAGLKGIADIPNFARPLIRRLLIALGDTRLAHIAAGVRSGGLPSKDYWELIADLNDYKEAYVTFMLSSKLDALLLPVCALPAFTHTKSKDLTPTCSYSFIFNLLKWPAGVVPMTVVEDDEEDYDLTSLPPNQRDSLAQKAAEQMLESAGLPIAVQLATLPNQDELCLHVMKVLEEHAPFDELPEPATATATRLKKSRTGLKRRHLSEDGYGDNHSTADSSKKDN